MVKSPLALATAAALVLGGGCGKPTHPVVNLPPSDREETYDRVPGQEETYVLIQQLCNDFVAFMKKEGNESISLKHFDEAVGQLMSEGKADGVEDLKKKMKKLGLVGGLPELDNLLQAGMLYFQAAKKLG